MIKVGQRLKNARQHKNVSLEEVAKATKIRASFLEAIEKGEYEKLPSPSYAQGFVRNYAEFVGLPEQEMIVLFRREFDQERDMKVLPKGFVNDKPLSLSSFKISQAMVGIGIIAVFVLGFLLYQYRYAFLNPPLEVTTPEENAVVSQEVVIKGETDPNVTLFVDNEPVTVGADGEFSKTITAFPGETVIVIKAENSFGRDSTIERTVQVQAGS